MRSRTDGPEPLTELEALRNLEEKAKSTKDWLERLGRARSDLQNAEVRLAYAQGEEIHALHLLDEARQKGELPPRKGILNRDLKEAERGSDAGCRLTAKKGTVVYIWTRPSYGVIPDNGVAVTLQPYTTPFYEIPQDSVDWRGSP